MGKKKHIYSTTTSTTRTQTEEMAESETVDILTNSSWAAEVDDTEESEKTNSLRADITKIQQDIHELTFLIESMKNNPFNSYQLPPPPQQPPMLMPTHPPTDPQEFLPYSIPQVITYCGQQYSPLHQSPPMQQQHHQQQHQPLYQNQMNTPPQPQPQPQPQPRPSSTIPPTPPSNSSYISQITYYATKQGDYSVVFNGQKLKHGIVVGRERKTKVRLEQMYEVQIIIPKHEDKATDIKIYGKKRDHVVNCVNEISNMLLAGF